MRIRSASAARIACWSRSLQPLGAFAQLDVQLAAGPDVEAQHRRGHHHRHQRGRGGRLVAEHVHGADQGARSQQPGGGQGIAARP
jgi:hypothetical protein